MHARRSSEDASSEPGSGLASGASLTVLVLQGAAADPASLKHTLAAATDVRIVEPAVDPGRGTAQPDVVVLELDARQADAEREVREAGAQWKPAPLLVSTACEDRARNRLLVRAGARGVVTHARHREHLLTAIRRIYAGEIWLARSCLSQLIDEMAAKDHPAPPHLASPAGLKRLTAREREVVALIAQGLHNKAIAAQLGITDHTVRHHLTAIFAKLGVADRLELAVYAFRHHRTGPGER